MHNFKALAFTAIAVLTGLASAAPAARATAQFALKTKVITGDPTKNGLYVGASHSGAGENDAILLPDLKNASPAFLNETNLQFNITPAQPNIPWGLTLVDSPAAYYAWEPVEIPAGYGTGGFAINDDGLVSSRESDDWVGWLACDWSRQAPQLFYRYYYLDIVLPSSCAIVKLIPVALAA